MKIEVLIGFAASDHRSVDAITRAVRSAAWHLGIPAVIVETEESLALQLKSARKGILLCPAHERGVYQGLAAGWIVVTSRRHQEAHHGRELFWVMSARPEVLARALLDIGRMGRQLQSISANAQSLAARCSPEQFDALWQCPLVSVIMPAYNVATSVSASIGSVLDQTVADIELIVVDDGSSDATRAQILKYSDPRIITCWQSGGGPSQARNRGLSLANSGAYITFLDADDVWQPTFLERTVEALATSSAALAYTDYLFSLDGSESDEIEVKDASFPALAMSEGLVPMGSFLIRREVYDVVGPFDERLDRGEDYVWLLGVAAQFDTVRVPEKLFHYRRSSHGQLLSNSPDASALQDARIQAFDLWAARTQRREGTR